MCLTECLNRDDFPERLGKNIAQESKKSTFGDVRRLKTPVCRDLHHTTVLPNSCSIVCDSAEKET